MGNATGTEKAILTEAGDPRSIARRDAFEKVTGRARFCVDSTMPYLAQAAVVRAERAHGEILDIDLAEALEAPGVLGIVTGSDLVEMIPRFGHIIADHPILAIDKVRYFGEPVAIVVAETVHEAADAAAMVWVDYSELEPLMDARSALDATTLIHTERYAGPVGGFLGIEASDAEISNVALEADIGWGDVDAAFDSAHLVVENTTHFPMVYAYAMETYNAIADFRGDSIHVISTAQHPVMVRKELSKLFGLPHSAVRVEVPFVGGGYGSKSYTKLEPLAAVASRAVGRPVHVTTDFEAAINTTRADGAEVTMRTAFSADGSILARDADIIMDTGAYADNSPLVLEKCVNRCFGPYRIPAVRVRGRAVYTNTTPASSYRGFGAPQGALAGELNLDLAASRLGINPVELRRRNVLAPGQTLIEGKRGLDADLLSDMETINDALLDGARADEPGIRRGRALALSASDAGASPTSTAMVRLHVDGSATLLTSSTEMGQGSHTVLAQIVARELGIGIERVAIGQSDTLFTPYEWTTGASRTTTIAGLAIQRACGDIWEKLTAMRAETMGVDPSKVDVVDHRLVHEDDSTAPADVIAAWFGAAAGEVVGIGIVRKSGATAVLPPFWEVGVVGVEVAVHEDTGEVDVEHLVIVGDVGHALNPSLVKGQDLGAATQGLGCALWEELVYEGQQLTNPNLVEYRVPRFRDIPKRITTVLAERADGVGPYGAKGGGEGALNPIPAAVASAVCQAIGLDQDFDRPLTLPLTPERVMELLTTAANSAAE
ncbi:MAG: CO/xanthine dehydrogenase Mo-binding subunit [Verrucomicrobiales bacterium]|jgi:CO/xanthine dehydrogenase Mo-binding subunit